MFNKLQSFKLCLLLLMSISIISCSDDDFNADDSATLPPVLQQQTQLDTINVGDSLVLQPQLIDTTAVIYNWTVNDSAVSNAASLTFIPKTRGDYTVQFTATNLGGDVTKTYKIHTYGAYENGFFIVNEGWFGHGPGTLTFYDYRTKALQDSAFIKSNQGTAITTAGSTLEFATIHNDKLILVAKVGGAVVIADAYSLKEEKRIPAQGGSNWYGFVGLNETQGLLSSTSGVFPLDLTTMTVGNPITGIEGTVGDIVKSGDYVFALSKTEGLVILNATTFAIEKTIPEIDLGFTVTNDHKVWAAGDTTLISIDPNSLNVEEITLPFTANGSWGAWHPGSITTDGINIYLAKNGSWFGGSEIYKYTIGDTTSLAEPFITLPEGKVLYGKGIAFDIAKQRLMVNAVDKGFGESFSNNAMYFYNDLGSLTKIVKYSGYYFPALTVFH